MSGSGSSVNLDGKVVRALMTLTVQNNNMTHRGGPRNLFELLVCLMDIHPHLVAIFYTCFI